MPMVKKKEILCSLQLLAILNRPDIYWQISLSVDFIIKLFYTNYARAKLILSMSTIVHTDFDWLLRLQRPSGKQSLDCIPPSLKCQQTDVMLAPCTAPRRAFKCTQTWRSATHQGGKSLSWFQGLSAYPPQYPMALPFARQTLRLSNDGPCAKFKKSQHWPASACFEKVHTPWNAPQRKKSMEKCNAELELASWASVHFCLHCWVGFSTA